jgi:CARDB
MTAVPGTRAMAVDFQLQERAGRAASFATVSAPGFGVWVASQPGVGIYTYDHEVTALPAPASFRVLVRARWIDRHRHVIRRDELTSPVCSQPLLAPNLEIRALRRTAGAQPGTATYNLTLLNAGTAAAGAFQASLTDNGATLPATPVASLAAGATQVVAFSGPRCTAGSSLTATVTLPAVAGGPAAEVRTAAFACPR